MGGPVNVGMYLGVGVGVGGFMMGTTRQELPSSCRWHGLQEAHHISECREICRR